MLRERVGREVGGGGGAGCDGAFEYVAVVVFTVVGTAVASVLHRGGMYSDSTLREGTV